ncbi:MAG TPA: hypothetical protein VNK52_14385 [Hyphomicrobiaceae bacterium]|nr:hypothetical protein [Hyphomicrobiaceae bacterium]
MRHEPEKETPCQYLADSNALLSILVVAADAADRLGERSVFMAILVALEILDSNAAQEVRTASRMLGQSFDDRLE